MAKHRVIFVEAAPIPLLAKRKAEMCEHKGIGHPDTITDMVCEAAGHALALEYERAFGRVLHFNVDKGLLIAGQSEPRFGGGRICEPIRLIICGRATDANDWFDIRDVVINAGRQALERNLQANAGVFHFTAELRPGSANLRQVYAGRRAIPLANDTSFGVGYAPYSKLERHVLDLSSILKSPDFHRLFPAAGDDFKIMGYRRGSALAFTLALAFIDRHIKSAKHYFRVKQEMHDHLVGSLRGDHNLRINPLDDSRAKDESGLYLTVSGLSAEMGDDGQVGRGNRVNGLITPGRSMSLEAVAGKNPVSHVGKIYNVFAHQAAHVICAEVPEVREATVQILSTIGCPIDEPELVIVEVGTEARFSPTIKKKVTALISRNLDELQELSRQLARSGLEGLGKDQVFGSSFHCVDDAR